MIEGSWNENDPSNHFHFQIGVDKQNEQFEVHVLHNGKPVFSYWINAKNCLLYSSPGKSMKFESGGAFPLPQIKILRDTEGGSFNYSFNLNFAKVLRISYPNVRKYEYSLYFYAKRKKVLLNHIYERKAMWLEPPASSDKGTVFTLKELIQFQYPKTTKWKFLPLENCFSCTLEN